MKLRNPSFCHPWFLRSLGRWKSAGLCAVLPLALVVSCKDSSKPVALQEAPQPAAPKAEAPDANSPSAAKPAAALQAGAEKISFSSQVRPILSNNCFACHGPDSHNQTSPFRLDTEEHSRANLAKALIALRRSQGVLDPERFGL